MDMTTPTFLCLQNAYMGVEAHTVQIEPEQRSTSSGQQTTVNK
jgi:hypothetical protein